MPEQFRFSPDPNRAHEIRWWSWDSGAFDEAVRLERPILLNLTAFWCQSCHRMDETTYSDDEIIQLLNAHLVPIRVDADQHPHVQDRYIAGGWPTNAFLTPTGEVLWAGTYVAPDEFREVARGVLNAWREQRAELQAEIDRRRKAMEASRTRRPVVGLVRRESADDVLASLDHGFDERNGGFGDAPKIPYPEAIELCYVRHARTGDDAWPVRAERTLDGMLAGELWDPVDGGFFRYAMANDWTAPRFEKILELNAALLMAYALGAQLTGRADWRRTAERIMGWADRFLARPDGFWAASQGADEPYYRLDEQGRRRRPAPPTDPVLYTHANAAWIRALVEAGGRLGSPDWIERAALALDRLLDTMAAPDDILHHFREDGESPALPGLLVDLLAAGRACTAAAQATGRDDFVLRARRLASVLESRLWADEGGFRDHLVPAGAPGALRLESRPFEANASAARFFLDLALFTGERGYRAVAERTLAVLSPLAGRYGAAGAEFVLALDEYFEAPLRFVIVGDTAAAAPLRAAALETPLPARRVVDFASGGRMGAWTFHSDGAPAVYACGARSCSPPITDPARLVEAVAAVR